MKEHKFVVTVKTTRSKRSAELAILAAFAGRQPDGCEFGISKLSVEDTEYIEGSYTGTHLAFNAIIGMLEEKRDELGLGRKRK